MNVLFVCSRNKWRSRTAEDLFKNSNFHNVRSAGTAPVARIKVSEKLVSWAEVIFVMKGLPVNLVFPGRSSGPLLAKLLRFM